MREGVGDVGFICVRVLLILFARLLYLGGAFARRMFLLVLRFLFLFFVCGCFTVPFALGKRLFGCVRACLCVRILDVCLFFYNCEERRKGAKKKIEGVKKYDRVRKFLFPFRDVENKKRGRGKETFPKCSALF